MVELILLLTSPQQMKLLTANSHQEHFKFLQKAWRTSYTRVPSKLSQVTPFCYCTKCVTNFPVSWSFLTASYLVHQINANILSFPYDNTPPLSTKFLAIQLCCVMAITPGCTNPSTVFLVLFRAGSYGWVWSQWLGPGSSPGVSLERPGRGCSPCVQHPSWGLTRSWANSQNFIESF